MELEMQLRGSTPSITKNKLIIKQGDTKIYMIKNSQNSHEKIEGLILLDFKIILFKIILAKKDKEL